VDPRSCVTSASHLAMRAFPIRKNRESVSE
jgi:hypothetical protein